MTWQEIKTAEQASAFLKLFGHFHDGCIREAHLFTGHHVRSDLSMVVSGELDTSMKFLVQRQFKKPSCVELLFEQITRINIVPTDQNYDSIIYNSSISVEGGDITWIIEKVSTADRLEANVDTWVRAKKLSWREANQNIGSDLIYGCN